MSGERTAAEVEAETRATIKSVRKTLARGNPQLDYVLCYDQLCTSYMIAAMIRWRRGESPVDDIQLAVAGAHELHNREPAAAPLSFTHLLLLNYAATGVFDTILDESIDRKRVFEDVALADAMRGNDESLHKVLDMLSGGIARYERWWTAYMTVYLAARSEDHDEFGAAFDLAEQAFLRRHKEGGIQDTDFIEGGGLAKYVLDRLSSSSAAPLVRTTAWSAGNRDDAPATRTRCLAAYAFSILPVGRGGKSDDMV